MRRSAPRGLIVGGFGWLEHVHAGEAKPLAEAPAGEEGPLSVDPRSGGFLHAPSLNQAAAAAIGSSEREMFASFHGVHVGPGATALARMPWLP